MYRRCAIQFHNKKMEFINSVNLIERIRRARSLPAGISHLGFKQYVVASSGMGKRSFLTIKDETKL